MSKQAKPITAMPPSREEKIFKIMPIWKSLLIMAIPAMILMLTFGLYTFMDNVLAINFADDAYKEIAGITSKDQVRLFMSGVTPVTTFIFSIVLLFGVGVSRRFSINIGAKNEERAIQTIKTTMQVALGVSFILIPILLFAAKPWMRSQFSAEPAIASLIADQGFKYVWIMIIVFPIQMFNQIVSSLFRAEARNKQMMIAMIIPIIFNLLFDWLFMGPGGMGIEGGAWATFVSYVMTTMILVFFMLKNKDSRVKFRNLIGFKGFRIITIIGVMLVGIAPFMRNMAQSITQTIEMRTIQDVSNSVYGNNMQMSLIMTAVFPIFGLFFPMMFGFIQAGAPITGYNYGAKNMKRVRQATLYVILYSFITSIFIYVIATFGLMAPLNHLLGITDKPWSVMTKDIAVSGDNMPAFKAAGLSFTPIQNASHIPPGWTMYTSNQTFHTLDKAQKMYGIMMISSMFFAPALGAMSLFGSTDRIFFNTIASSLRGFILLTPFLFAFAALAKDQNYDIVQNNIGTNGVFSIEFLFWWFYPALALTASTILLIMTIFVLKRIDRKSSTIEDRLNKIYDWSKKRKLARK